MKTHTLKCWPEYFHAVKRGEKSFEYRRDDRGFEVGDVILLREFDPETETESGEEFSVRVTYIARGSLIPGGFCVMSIEPSDDLERRAEALVLKWLEAGRYGRFDMPMALKFASEALAALEEAKLQAKAVSHA